MKFASATHVGLVRQENEDFIIAKAPIFIVADGMGGHSAGGVASKMAAQAAYKIVSTYKGGGDALQLLKNAVAVANQKVIEKSLQLKTEKGMGTTFTMTLIEDLNAYFAHIGDSRAYLLRGSKFKQITEDHSMVAEMVKQGKITKKEARQHPYRNVITKAVGSETSVEADIFKYQLQPGDKLLLSSDGLTGSVKDSEIKKIIASQATEEACQDLIKLANARGGSDNISVIIVEIDGSSSAASKKDTGLIAKLKEKIVRIFKRDSINHQPSTNNQP